jgi:hypothetical protein
MKEYKHETEKEKEFKVTMIISLIAVLEIALAIEIIIATCYR